MQDQYAVASAITGVEKIQADAAATYNQLRREGVSHALALATAEQQVQNALAAAEANVIRQTQALEEQTALIEARLKGTEATVAAEQAYARAIREGASEMAASDLATATARNIRASTPQKEYVSQNLDQLVLGGAAAKIPGGVFGGGLTYGNESMNAAVASGWQPNAQGVESLRRG